MVSVLTVFALDIDLCKANQQTRMVKGLHAGRTGNFNAGRLVCGGNLFNGYARGRDLPDDSDLRLQRTRLSQTGFLAGWRASDFATQQFC